MLWKLNYTNIFLVFGKQNIKISPAKKGGQAILNEDVFDRNSLSDVFWPARRGGLGRISILSAFLFGLVIKFYVIALPMYFIERSNLLYLA